MSKALGTCLKSTSVQAVILPFLPSFTTKDWWFPGVVLQLALDLGALHKRSPRFPVSDNAGFFIAPIDAIIQRHNFCYGGALSRKIMKELDPILGHYKNMPEPVRGFMDGVDYEEHLENDMKGTLVFPSVEHLKKAKPCTKQCGIIEVEVSFVRVVQPQDFSQSIARAKAIRAAKARRKGQSEDQPQGDS